MAEDRHIKIEGKIQGVTLEAFLQMINTEGKTCTLKVGSLDGVGYIYILDGELIAAEVGVLKNEAAVFQMLCWDNAVIEIKNVCLKKTRDINQPLLNLLMEGLRIRDERELEKKERVDDTLSEEEMLVEEYVGSNQVDAAVNLLFKMIVEFAARGDFLKADALREKLLEVDPMALMEISESGEIIEEKKRGFLDENHLRKWSRLYDTLTTEETNALYYFLSKAIYKPDDYILRQNEFNPNLYFIEKGQLTVLYRQGNLDKLIKRLAPGDIVGQDTFFYFTVCTASVTAVTDVELYFLNRDLLLKLRDNIPSMGSKLYSYCLGLEKINDLVVKKSIERRQHKRVEISGKVAFHILGVSGKPDGRSFTGELVDISAGGLCFLINVAQKKTLRFLLGRDLRVECTLDITDPPKKIDKKGTVVAVVDKHLNTYSVHLQFEDSRFIVDLW